jgi:hypothetical protein
MGTIREEVKFVATFAPISDHMVQILGNTPYEPTSEGKCRTQTCVQDKKYIELEEAARPSCAYISTR